MHLRKEVQYDGRRTSSNLNQGLSKYENISIASCLHHTDYRLSIEISPCQGVQYRRDYAVLKSLSIDELTLCLTNFQVCNQYLHSEYLYVDYNFKLFQHNFELIISYLFWH
jgi:hypothetical protein